MPEAREMLLWVRQNRPAYDAWRFALEWVAYEVHDAAKVVNPELVDRAVRLEVDGTPALLFSSRVATRAALYAMGYGKYRERVAAKMVELRLTSC